MFLSGMADISNKRLVPKPFSSIGTPEVVVDEHVHLLEQHGHPRSTLEHNLSSSIGSSNGGSFRSHKASFGAPLPSAASPWRYTHDQFWSVLPAEEDPNIDSGRRDFYRRQRLVLQGFRDVDELVTAQPFTEEQKHRLEDIKKGETTAVRLSNGVNLLLFVAKGYASVSSGSLAVIASTLDSLLDLVAGGILWMTAWSMREQNKYKYPVGNQRMQPVGIIVFAAIMATLGVQVLLEGVKQLMSGYHVDAQLGPSELFWVATVFLSVIVSKLGLFLLCRMYDNEIVQAYAMDHFFDIVTNTVSLAAVFLARHFFWWLDPGAAIIISLYTIFNWSTTVFQNAVSLVGVAAPPEFISKVTYMVFNHDVRIRKIDTVRAWTFGSLYMVEVDIELPEDMVLKEAHDIGESLQNKLESMAEVDRAFVHLDYESSHKPEHMGPQR